MADGAPPSFVTGQISGSGSATMRAAGQGADAFLGTQGDPWDTQSDMFFALINATVLRRWHEQG